jgi:two-component system, OmpR family, phosphate regulon sensor histidine kinase PhoR
LTRFRPIENSLRARLIVGYVLVAAVFSAAWIWSLYGPLTQAAQQQQVRNLTSIARAGALFSAESSQTATVIARRVAEGSDLRVTVVAADGAVLADTRNNPATMENHAGRPEIAAALAGRVGTAERESATERTHELYVAVPATLDGRRIVFRVSQPLADVQAIAATSRRVGLVLLLVALGIAAAIGAWAARATSGPIRDLSVSASRMAAGDLGAEIPPVPEDLSELAVALATLRDQVRARLEALDAERRTLRTALDGLADAVFVVDGDAIQLANAAASELFRQPPSGWGGTPLDRAGLPESLAEPIRAHLGAMTPFSAELAPDPTGRTLRVFVASLDAEKPGGRTLVVVSDVTERARLEAIRRDFVANASHELKTPVAGIQLLAESAETAAGDGDAEQALAFTRQIETEASRLKRLVGDLLDLSRLESADASEALADVRSAVDLAVSAHRSAATRRGLALETDLSAVRGLDVFVRAEPADLAIALDNLLDNAIAYTAQGSVRLALQAGDASVTIVVRDTGSGIASEHLPRIFERFYRVDGARSRESGGTGLGLSLVRHVVERSGGAVAVESEMGSGSTFTLTLPRAV